VIEELNHKNGLVFSLEDKPHTKCLVVKSNYKPIKDGSIVILEKFSGTSIEFEDDKDSKYYIINPYPILGILNEKKKM
jgi:co-chaperonin GroES (HSP10)